MSTPGRYKGCAKTGPSTLKAPSFPNCLEFTFAGVRIFSLSVAPVRWLLYCEVVTWAEAGNVKAMAHAIARNFICVTSSNILGQRVCLGFRQYTLRASSSIFQKLELCEAFSRGWRNPYGAARCSDA